MILNEMELYYSEMIDQINLEYHMIELTISTDMNILEGVIIIPEGVFEKGKEIINNIIKAIRNFFAGISKRIKELINKILKKNKNTKEKTNDIKKAKIINKKDWEDIETEMSKQNDEDSNKSKTVDSGKEVNSNINPKKKSVINGDIIIKTIIDLPKMTGHTVPISTFKSQYIQWVSELIDDRLNQSKEISDDSSKGLLDYILKYDGELKNINNHGISYYEYNRLNNVNKPSFITQNYSFENFSYDKGEENIRLFLYGLDTKSHNYNIKNVCKYIDLLSNNLDNIRKHLIDMENGLKKEIDYYNKLEQKIKKTQFLSGEHLACVTSLCSKERRMQTWICTSQIKAMIEFTNKCNTIINFVHNNIKEI